MHTILNTDHNPSSGQVSDRKSRFIGMACHINNQKEALDFVQSVRQNNPKARHVCYCAIWGTRGQIKERMSDDGEPSGTAGKPILEVMRRQDISDCLITVTRYFGGILLGSGGLIRNYSSAASLALEHARPARVITSSRCRAVIDYPDYQRLHHLVMAQGGTIAEEAFTNQVTVTYDIPLETLKRFESEADNLFQGRIQAETLATVQSLIPLDQTENSQG